MRHEKYIEELPLVAILRGLDPARAVAIGEALYEAGLRVIEVPMNSPEPLRSIEALARSLGSRALIGAGTVLVPELVDKVKDAGGELIVTPNTDPGVIARTVACGLSIMPGFATASEALTAIKAGARRLKLFPASVYGPSHLKALKAVLPRDVMLYAVGGIGAEQIGEWLEAGASGFGFGSELFKPDLTTAAIGAKARSLISAFKTAYQDHT